MPNPIILSYVTHCTHFLQIMDTLDNLPDQVFLVTMDVTSLYANIPVQEGLEAIKILLEKEDLSQILNPRMKPSWTY